MKISVFNSAGRRFIISFLLTAATIIYAADHRGSTKVRAAREHPPRASSDDGPTRLETSEGLSESLANDLLEFSAAARERDASRLARFFAPEFRAAFFTPRPLAVRNEVKWIGTRDWATVTVVGHRDVNQRRPPEASREVFIRDWVAFTRHFKEIEDVRFAVDRADFGPRAKTVPEAEAPTAEAGSIASARLSFYVLGRNGEGRREWTRGAARASFRAGADNRWQFLTFSLSEMRSLVASTDLFSEVSAAAGVAASMPAYLTGGNGGFVWRGAAAADFDRDGWVDLFVAAARQNYLYLNDRKGNFRDASREVAVQSSASGVAPLALDYDNDGDEDVFISADGAQVLLENRLVPDGTLEFRDVSAEAGVGIQAIGYGATVGDVNNDGLPDIYVACYNRYGKPFPDSWFRATNGTPNLLFVNQGDGTFREEAARRGVDDRRWSYAAAFADVNGDGRQDLFVANDFGEKGMYINRGGTFVDEARERGVLDPGNGMGMSFGDYNNDGLLDLHATNMSSATANRILSAGGVEDEVMKKLAAGNSLFENTGGGRFRDVAPNVGGLTGGWAWGGGFIDFDNDGWEDLFTTNGYISGRSAKDTCSHYWRQVITRAQSGAREDQDRLVEKMGYSFCGYERDTLHLSLGGKKFLNISGVSGIDSATDGRAAVFADFDNDGDLDVFTTTIQGAAHLLFRNNVGQSSNYLRVVLEGDQETGRDAYGTIVRVKTTAGTLTKIKAGGSGFISQHDPRLLFGLGADANALGVEVTWPSGRVEQFAGDFRAGFTLLLRKGAGRAVILPRGAAGATSSSRAATFDFSSSARRAKEVLRASTCRRLS